MPDAWIAATSALAGVVVAEALIFLRSSIEARREDGRRHRAVTLEKLETVVDELNELTSTLLVVRNQAVGSREGFKDKEAGIRLLEQKLSEGRINRVATLVTVYAPSLEPHCSVLKKRLADFTVALNAWFGWSDVAESPAILDQQLDTRSAEAIRACASFLSATAELAAKLNRGSQ